MISTARSVSLLCLVVGTVVLVAQRAAQTREPDASAPKPVAVGSVGESGASSVLVHRLQGGAKRRVVLRNTRSSLCGNTGAVALLVVNSEPKVHGALTKVGSTIEVDANPKDRVIATVTTIPLFNEIVCTRLGELHVALEVHAP